MKTLASIATTAILLATITACENTPDLGGAVDTARNNTSPERILCASTGLYLDRLDAGGKGARQAARLIAKASPDPNVDKAASIIAENPADPAARKVLRGAVDRLC